MVSRADVSVRDAADLLHIDPSVIGRLCRHLNVDAGGLRVPLHVVDDARQHSRPEERYAMLRSWLLDHCIGAWRETRGDVGRRSTPS